ncbi:MAG: MATE family efflux transporter [Eubacteriales bacterium]|nr:MATE family efflux transporter [Eubacteriales bacterium]
MVMVALQNLVAYSVNMLDNIMLGSYAQTALSGAATVNQVFFLVQQTSIALCDSLVILASQYYGQGRMTPVRKITGLALKLGLGIGLFYSVLSALIPNVLLRIFTRDAAIIAEGQKYMQIILLTFPLFILSGVLMASLRCVGTVRISFLVSVVSLIINACINYTLIFGHFGFPEMGVRGAAVGTLVARIVELLIVLSYVRFKDEKLRLFSEDFLSSGRQLASDFLHVAVPVLLAGLLWAVSVPLQTAILGHLPGPDASDAIAANSVATTFYQYLKVVVSAMASASAVVMGQSVGRGDLPRIHSDSRTLACIDVAIGLVLAFLLFILRGPLLSYYSLTDNALRLANQIMIVMCFVMIGMAYQMPVCNGILRGSGDTTFSMWLNIISVWGIVMPLSLLCAFVWKLPVPIVVLAIQSDQIFKGLPIFLRVRSGKWIRHLTRD